MRMAVLGLIAPVFLASCDMLDEHPPLAPTKPAAMATATIRIDTTNGPKAISVEIAGDAVSQERGLMYRTQLAPDAGMLFDFHQEVRVSFWMKNTPLPLDMVFIKKDGTVSSVEPNAIPYSTSPIPSAEPVRAVLEINAGRARDLGIKPGDRVRAPIFHDMD